MELGKGNFGRVVKGIRHEVQAVALKITLVRGNDIKSQQDFIREIAMMKYVSRDSHIVQFYGGCIFRDSLCLIVEYMEVSLVVIFVVLTVEQPGSPLQLTEHRNGDA